MHLGQEKKHIVLKIILGICVLFLVLVAVKDWTPAQTQIEKTVVYGQK